MCLSNVSLLCWLLLFLTLTLLLISLLKCYLMSINPLKNICRRARRVPLLTIKLPDGKQDSVPHRTFCIANKHQSDSCPPRRCNLVQSNWWLWSRTHKAILITHAVMCLVCIIQNTDISYSSLVTSIILPFLFCFNDRMSVSTEI